MDKNTKPLKVVASTKLTSVGVWSLAYTSLLYAFVLGIIWNIVVFICWKALESANAVGKIDEQILKVAGSDSFQFAEVITQGRVMGISVVLTLVFVAATPLFAIILGGLYSAIAAYTGGVRINLTSTILPELAEEAKKSVEKAIPVAKSEDEEKTVVAVENPVEPEVEEKATEEKDAGSKGEFTSQDMVQLRQQISDEESSAPVDETQTPPNARKGERIVEKDQNSPRLNFRKSATEEDPS